MKKDLVGLIDYGLGNMQSICSALAKVKANYILINKKDDFKKVTKLVLPGVGSFKQGMENLNKLGYCDEIISRVKKKVPILGICLGMQLLAEEGNEGGKTTGLGLIEGKVSKMVKSKNFPLPHTGWNKIFFKKELKILKNIPSESFFYFIHSYHFELNTTIDSIGLSNYGKEFVSFIKFKNIYGIQSHPEKSQLVGLNFLRNFVNGN